MAAGTSGGAVLREREPPPCGTAVGATRLTPIRQAAVFATLLLATLARDVATIALEQAGRPEPLPAWQYVTWEVSSRLALALLIPLVQILWRRLHPARLGWIRSVLGHGAASLGFSLGHVGLMVLFRKGAYLAAGETYRFGSLPFSLIYEYQKDLLTYLVLLLVFWGMARLFPLLPAEPSAAPTPVSSRAAGGPGIPATDAPADAPADALDGGIPATPPVFTVRQGWRTLTLPAEALLRIEAAGNYVELVAADGRHLHRATLAGLEERLRPAGFVRVHRGHLVNLAAVRQVLPTPNGDATAVLANGDRVPVSRRFRAALAAVPGPGGDPAAP